MIEPNRWFRLYNPVNDKTYNVMTGFARAEQAIDVIETKGKHVAFLMFDDCDSVADARTFRREATTPTYEPRHKWAPDFKAGDTVTMGDGTVLWDVVAVEKVGSTRVCELVRVDAPSVVRYAIPASRLTIYKVGA